MKKIILTLILTTVMVNAWAIQTHRAINRTAYEKADNLESFMVDALIDKNENYENYEYSKLADWANYKKTTYFKYITLVDEAMMGHRGRVIMITH